MKTKYPTLVKAALLALSLCPPLYLFCVVQYSAITVPFWDHTELIKLIDAYKSGTFTLEQLWAPHNHSRPLTYRAIYLANAILTDWDIRSEYIYMYLAIYAAFLVHVRILYERRGGRFDLGFFFFLSILAAFYFSPVGHNNHWWSMMLQLNLANVFILLALWQVSKVSSAWGPNVSSALWCWLATYTLTNGLIAFLVCAALALFSSGDRRAFAARLAFWGANLALVLIFYLPGLPDEGGQRPDLARFLWFTFVYLGSPVGSFIDYRFTDPFSVIRTTSLNGVLGLGILICGGLFARSAWRGARKGGQMELFFLGCLGFAAASAMLTGWGRAAFDELGLANANASRYAIFSSYSIFGFIQYFAGRPFPLPASALHQNGMGSRRLFRYLPHALLAVVVVAGAATYWKALRVYRIAHDFDKTLMDAYYSGDRIDEALDRRLFPNPEFSRYLRTALQRYELGPYRNRATTRAEVPSEKKFIGAIPLDGSVVISQKVFPQRNYLKGLELRLVTYGRKGSPAVFRWEILDVTDSRPRTVAHGNVDARRVGDWSSVKLPIPWQPRSAGREYELVVHALAGPHAKHPVGLPLFASSGDFPAARVRHSREPEAAAAGTLNLVLRYDN